jgi:hypothetical protein
MTVPGIGPIISSAVVAAIGDGAGFKQGRGLQHIMVVRCHSQRNADAVCFNSHLNKSPSVKSASTNT